MSSLTKEEKITIVAKYFKEHGGSMIEVSEALKKDNINISKSSVQRYLNDKSIIKIFDEQTYELIQKRLKQQKEDGIRRGSLTFITNNSYIKDKIGYLNSSRSKTR